MVEVSFAVSNFDTQGSQLILDGFKGKNLLFLDKKEVFSSKLYNMSALEEFFQSEKEKAKSNPDNAFWD